MRNVWIIYLIVAVLFGYLGEKTGSYNGYCVALFWIYVFIAYLLYNERDNYDFKEVSKGLMWVTVVLVSLAIYYSYFDEKKNDGIYPNIPVNLVNYEEDCSSLVPSNPYNYGSGHYAGYEWGERGNNCSGNSSSFIEGCEEFESQDEVYNSCLTN